MKNILFAGGIFLLFVSISNFRGWGVSRETLIIFGFLLLISFFEEMEEFNFFGLRGKKVDKELKRLLQTINLKEEATNPPPEQKDDLSKLRDKDIQLMGVDRGNFLALVFEIERLLRLMAQTFYPDQVNDSTPPKKLGELLRKNGYLTESGIEQWTAMLNVRNLIVHGRISNDEDQKLEEWIEVAYKFYEELVDDINNKSKTSSNNE